MPESQTLANISYALTKILNYTTEPITLDFSEPINREEFNTQKIKNVDFNNLNESTNPKN